MSIENRYPALANKVAEAREAGYQDEEIESYLAEREQAALEEGYKQEDVDAFLGRVENQSTGVLDDVGRMFGMGLNQVAGAFGGVVEQAGKVTGLESVEGAGKWIQDKTDSRAEELSRQLSWEQKQAREKKFTQNEEGERAWGEAWKDPRAYLGLVAESAPATIIAIASGGVLTRAATKVAPWLGRTGAAALGYGAGEGAMAGTMAGKQVVDEIHNTPWETLVQTEEFRKAYHSIEDESMTHEDKMVFARSKLETAAYGEAAGKTGIVTTILSAPTGIAFDRMLRGAGLGKAAKPKATDILKYTAGEGLQEAPQGGSEEYISGTTLQKYADPSINPMDNVLEAAVSEGIAGVAMGAPTGVATHATGRSRYKQVKNRIGQLESEIFSPAGEVNPDVTPDTVSEYLGLTGVSTELWNEAGRPVLSPYARNIEPEAAPESEQPEVTPEAPASDVQKQQAPELSREKLQQRIANIEKTPLKNRTTKQLENLTQYQDQLESMEESNDLSGVQEPGAQAREEMQAVRPQGQEPITRNDGTPFTSEAAAKRALASKGLEAEPEGAESGQEVAPSQPPDAGVMAGSEMEQTTEPTPAPSGVNGAIEAGQSQRSESATPDFEEMVKEAARWRGAALNHASSLDKKGKYQVSKRTTKGDLDAYLMRKYGIDETEARDVSNALTQRNVEDDRTADPADYEGEEWQQIGNSVVPRQQDSANEYDIKPVQGGFGESYEIVMRKKPTAQPKADVAIEAGQSQRSESAKQPWEMSRQEYYNHIREVESPGASNRRPKPDWDAVQERVGFDLVGKGMEVAPTSKAMLSKGFTAEQEEAIKAELSRQGFSTDKYRIRNREEQQIPAGMGLRARSKDVFPTSPEHERAIRQALADGHAVSPDVLAEYPELQSGTVASEQQDTAANTVQNDLPAERRSFIEGKVSELGSIEAVDQQYSDDTPVDRYAREYARQAFGAEEPKAQTGSTNNPKVKNFEDAQPGDIYTTKIRESGEIVERFAIRGDNPRGAGDTLHGTYGEAVTFREEERKRNEANAEMRRKEDDEQKDREAAEAVERQEYEDADGFTEGMNRLRKGSVLKTLNKKVRTPDGKVVTQKQFIRDRVKAGATLETRRVDKIKPMSRRAYNRATGREQQAHERKVEQGGEKTEYYISNPDVQGALNQITKTEYDYAQYLQSRPGDTSEAKPAQETKAAETAAQEGKSATESREDQETTQKPSANTIFTEDAAEEARRIIRASLSQTSAGFDPKLALAGLTLAGYHIEKGARSFAAYAQAMVEDMGDMVKPHLKAWYMAVRYEPSAAEMHADMDPLATVEAADVDALLAPETEEVSKKEEFPPSEDAKTENSGIIDSKKEVVSNESGETGSEFPEVGTPETPGVQPGRGADPQYRAGQADQGNMAGEQSEDVPGSQAPADTGQDSVRAPRTDVAGKRPPGSSGDATDGRTGDGGTGVADAGAGRRRVTGPGNFHIANPEEITGGGQVARFEKNKAAIETYYSLQEEQRKPTREEQAIMAGYTGWGSYGQELFKGTWERPAPAKGWEARDEWLRDHLGEEDWKSAQRSILNAHYTDPPTVTAMWDMVKRMGFNGGRVLEPAMGIGNFFGMMPKGIKGKSSLVGIELDSLTGGMAQMLYPDANISIKPYQDSNTPDGFYDLAIGNWPFAGQRVADRRYRKVNPVLHDYFFLKAIDQVRPGGIVIGVTSHGTMDKVDKSARRAMAQKAELVSAFRLPSGAFEEYAGTKVVTDIIVLRKRAKVEGIANDSWVNVVDYEVPSSGAVVKLNQYYQDNPDHIIGTIDYGSGTTTGRPGLIVNRPADVAKELRRAVEMVPRNGFKKDPNTENISYIANHTDDRQNSVTKTKAGLFVVKGEHLAPANDFAKYKVKSQTETAKREEQITRLIDIRKSYAQVIEAERAGAEDTEAKRADLRKQYQAFVKKHGRLGQSYGLKYLKKVGDPFYPSLAALELEGGKPAKILSQSTVRSTPKVDNPSVEDAFVLARNDAVSPSLSSIAEMANTTEEEARKILVDSGAVFETLDRDIIPADIYLSGNVREKLHDAEDWVKDGNKHLERNIKALREVIPEDIPYHKIEVQMGATWIPTEMYEEYVAHMLNLESADNISASFVAGRWKIDFPTRLNHTEEAQAGFGSSEIPFKRLVNLAVSNQTTTIRRKDEKGNKYVDEEATREVTERINKIREEFKQWVWSEPGRRVDLEYNYNEVMNAYAIPKYDGSFLKFPGMSLTLGDNPFNLRKHQVDAIWRGLVTRRSLNAHEVGTGKTFTMGGIAVESRRFGIAKKPMLLAHNANSATVAKEIQDMYPAAQILYIDNLTPSTIDVKLRQIANDDWDLVVVPHSLIDRLTLTEETLMGIAQEEIDAFEAEAIEAASEDGIELTPEMMSDEDEVKKLRSPTAKDLVRARNKIIESIKSQAQRSSRATAVPFEELGVDMLLVDEAHEFKKPPIVTKMRMKGMNTGTSAQSISLQFLTRYIRAQNEGRNVHLFTGTPITNTLTEIYHQMRYIMENDMADAGVDRWDGWFGAFASEVSDVELNAAAEYESVTRLASFINVADLRRMIGQYMDVVFSNDMPEMKPRTTDSGKTLEAKDLTEKERIELDNGRTENAVGRPYKRVIVDNADMTPDQVKEFERLQKYARKWRKMSKKDRRKAMLEGDPSSPIITETMAAKASFDVRLMREEDVAGQEGQLPDHEDSKASRVVKNILEVYNSHDKATQVVFAERGFGTTAERSKILDSGEKSSTKIKVFSPVKDIVERLVKEGIPRAEIAVVDGSTSKKRRKEIAEHMNTAELRVVIGNTKTLGVGVNMQRNLRAMHHLDAPWMPGDLEQRNGRGHRQGNQWNTVLEYRYITDRLDGRRWQVLAIKQRFIREFLKANDDVRVIEGDAASDEQSDILETFANAAGDPRILLLEKVRKKVDQLQSKEKMHNRAVAEARASVRRLEREMPAKERELKDYTDEVIPAIDKALANNKDKKISANLLGKKLSTRKGISEALAKIAEEMRQGDTSTAIGTIFGFKVRSHFSRLADQPSMTVKIGDQEIMVNKLSLASLEASLRNEKKHADKIQENIENDRRAVKRMKQVAEEPFAREKDLAAAMKEENELLEDMENNPVPPPAWLRNGAAVDTVVYRNGKPFEVTGHRWSNDGWFVLGKDAKGQTVIPYLEATDEQGVQIYEEKEFEAPEVVEQRPDEDDKPQESATLQENSGGVVNEEQAEFNFDMRETATSEDVSRARNLLRGRGRRGGTQGTLLGKAITRSLKAKGGVSLIGRKVRQAKDLAALAQVYRNPEYETFRLFFTKGGEIVGQTAVSSRLPGVAPLFAGKPTKENSEQKLQELREQQDNIGADGFWLLHNHPSGNVEESRSDVNATAKFAQNLKGFQGHVIINHNKYSVLSAAAGYGGELAIESRIEHETFTEKDELLTPEKPHPLLGRLVKNPEEVAAAAAELKTEDGYFSLFSHNKAGIRGIMEIPVDAINSRARLAATVRKFARQTGGQDVFAVLPNNAPDALVLLAQKGVAHSFLRDVVNMDGDSLGMNKGVSKSMDKYFGQELKGQTVAEGGGKYSRRKPGPVESRLFDTQEHKAWYSAVQGAFSRGNFSKEKIAEILDNANTAVLDRLNPVKKNLGEHVYRLHRLMGNSHATMQTFLEHGELSWKDQALTVLTKDKGFLPWLERLGDDAPRLFKWMAVRRAAILDRQGRENWLTADQRKALLDELFEGLTPEQRRAKIARFEQLNKEFQKWNRNIIKIAREAGLISEEQIEAWTSDYYLPFYRIMENEMTGEEFMRAPRKAKQHVSAQIKRLKGGKEKLGDPIENIMRNWSHLIQASQANVARQAAADVAVDIGVAEVVSKADLTNILGTHTTQQWAVRGAGSTRATKIFDDPATAEMYRETMEGRTGRTYEVVEQKNTTVRFGNQRDFSIVSYQDNGETVYLRINDPDLFEAMSEVNIKAFESTTMKIMGLSKRVLTVGATATAGFRIANLFRDTIHTAMVSKSFIPFLDSAKGLAEVWNKSDAYIELMASGGGFSQGWVDSGDPKAMARATEKIVKRKGGGSRGIILDTPRKMWDFWERVGHASEMAARVQLYKNLKAKGQSHMDAAFEARDLMDFQRSGASTSVRVLTATVPFLNARFQGLNRMYRGAKADPKAFWTKGAITAGASLMLWSLFKDDERYKELEDWEKFAYHHFWIGEQHFRLPKAFETGALFSTMFEAGADVMSGNEEFGYFVDFLTHTTTETFAIGLPQLISPAMEVYSNKSAFTGRDIESMALQRLPSGERAHPWTPEMLKDFGRLTGISPVKAEAIIRGYTAAIGGAFLTVGDAMYRHATSAAPRPAATVNDMPGVGRFVRDGVNHTKYATRYYDFAREVNETVAVVNNYKKIGNFEMARKILEENMDSFKYKRFVSSYSGHLAKLRRKKEIVWADNDMTREEKRIKMDEIQKDENKLYRKAYRMIYGEKG